MIITRIYKETFCPDCGAKRKIRKEYFSESGNLCRSCSGKKTWSKPEYKKKQTISHLGYKNETRLLPEGESNFNRLFYTYKKSSEDRGLEFNITKEQFKIITKQNCYYCGIEPLQISDAKQSGRYNGVWLYNGIDRKDDSIGYKIENCVPACKKCNYAKQGMTTIEFLKHIEKIYKYNIENRFNGEQR